MKKVVSYIILAVIILCIFIFIIPDKINKKYNAVITYKDSKQTEKTVLEVEGSVYRNLFKSNEFEGQIKRDKFTNNISFMVKKGEIYKGHLLQLDNENGDDQLLGSIYISKDFKKIYINFLENNSYLAAPADTNEEAQKIIQELEEK